MTKNNTDQNNTLHIPTREEFHRSFAGVICSEDFDSSRTARNSIKKIIQSRSFDKQCSRNTKIRERRMGRI